MPIITLLGEPKSTQHIYKAAARGGFVQFYMTREGKDIKEVYQWEAKAQWRDKPLTNDLKLSVRFFFKTKRKADLDNFNKLWQDALSGVLYDDDSQIDELHLYRDYDPKKPRIEISVLV